ncbi:MAG: hypothetical protein H7Y04_01885 [Verrucomicrobia bacterium]|nr:hypothetical protein [Cytophagales bacterium]
MTESPADKKTKAYIASIGFFIGGTAFLILSLSQLVILIKFNSYSVPRDGYVASYNASTKNRKYQVKYITLENEEQIMTFSAYEWYEVNDKIPIRYNPAQPSQAILDDYNLFLKNFILALMVALACYIYSFVNIKFLLKLKPV